MLRNLSTCTGKETTNKKWTEGSLEREDWGEDGMSDEEEYRKTTTKEKRGHGIRDTEILSESGSWRDVSKETTRVGQSDKIYRTCLLRVFFLRIEVRSETGTLGE